MISKELLSEVLGYKCNPQFTKVALARGELAYYANSDNTMTKANFINIYELAHKCKEWAHKEGWWVDSNLNFVSIGKLNQSVSWKTFNGYDLKMKEADLIYHSCQWILDKRKVNNH